MKYVEATFKIICYLSNVRDKAVFWILMIVFWELELDLFSQEKFKNEVHNFLIFLCLKVVIAEHVYTSANHQFSPTFVQMYCTYWSIARISQRTWCQYWIGWWSYCQWRTIYIYKISAQSFWLFLILFLFILPSTKIKHVIMPSLWLLRISIDNSCYLLIENSIVNVGLFGVKIFVEGSTNYTVAVDWDAEMLGYLVDIGIISELIYLLLSLASFVG